MLQPIYVHLKTWSTDLPRINNSHVSVAGKKSGLASLYFIRQSYTAAASFVGTKSRKVVIVVASRGWQLGSAQEEIPMIWSKNDSENGQLIFNHFIESMSWTCSFKETKTVAIRAAIAFKHAIALHVYSSFPRSSSRAASLWVTKLCQQGKNKQFASSSWLCKFVHKVGHNVTQQAVNNQIFQIHLRMFNQTGLYWKTSEQMKNKKTRLEI